MDLTTLTLEQIEASAQATKKVAFLKDDNGEPILGFVIVGKDSKEYRDCAAVVRSSAIRSQMNRKTKIDRSTEEGSMQLDQLLQANEHKLAVAVSVDWFGFTQPDPAGSVGEDGKPVQVPVPFDRAKAEHILTVKPTWREKITAALEDEEGFLLN